MKRDYTYFKNTGVEGRHRSPTLCDWLIWIGCAFIALILGAILFWVILVPHEAKGAIDPLCGLEVVVCEGEYNPPIKNVKYVESYVTEFNKESSCHYPDGKGGCLTASGRKAESGIVACSNSFRLGTRVNIGGVVYECQDRYAKWVDALRVLPTYDIWTDGTTQDALKFGLQKQVVEIIED